jgi:hypothetical protein
MKIVSTTLERGEMGVQWVTFFELKRGFRTTYSVWCTGHYLMQKGAPANGAR